MTNKPTVTINGRQYDAVTGLPVVAETTDTTGADEKKIDIPQVNTQPSHAHQLHSQTQRSQTLNRKFTKKPTPAKTAIITRGVKPNIQHDIRPVGPHAQVRKFAPHPVVAPKSVDVAPVTHPHVAKAHALSAAKTEQKSLTSHVAATAIKQQAITNAVANTKSSTKPHKQPFWRQRQRVTGIITATFALVLLGGYFTYLNMPSLSVRVAAAQAGINAAFPDYRPDGYALNGPVTYSDGRVSMNFKANASDVGFELNQSKSSWSSDAVLDNYVAPRAGSSYMPYTERGLTIYTYKNNAAWVNGGILYTIEGNAPLSSEQIRRIATSLL